MRFVNGTVFCEDGIFRKREFSVTESVFSDNRSKDEIINLQGKTVIPGLVDTHIHGGRNYDFTSGTIGDLKNLAFYLAKNGITSFLPTSLTASFDVLKQAYKNAAKLLEETNAGAKIAGIHMEGPFLSYQKKGAQNAEFLSLPDLEVFLELNRLSGGMIKIVCIAPELAGASDFISAAAKTCIVAAAHTSCAYEDAKKAFSVGITRLTHLFNAMPPLLHREPGIIGAAAEDGNVYAELICDGVHVHESAVRAAFSLFGPERIVLISDGVSFFESQEQNRLSSSSSYVKNGAAVLDDGKTLSGSVITLFDCMKKAIFFGIPSENAIIAATKNPALSVGIYDKAGSITVGKQADFVVCDPHFNLETVYLNGKIVR